MNTLKALTLAICLAALAAPGMALGAPPGNDLFANAAELTGRSSTVAATSVEAMKELNEPNHAANSGGASIWYWWTAPAGGRVVVGTCYSEFNTLLGVYTGDAVGSLVQVAANDNSCGQQSRLSFQAVSGTTYRIAVDGFGGDSGYVALTLDLTPPNDDFADSQEISGDAGSVNGSNVGATTETAESAFGPRSVWFRWSAPSSGWATFQTCGSSFDTVLAAYTGAAIDDLTTVGVDDDSCDLGSRVSFEAAAGTVYRIAVTGFWEEAMGDYVLSWNRNPPPPSPFGIPYISGILRDGETVTASDGTWSGVGPFTYTHAWSRCDRDFDCALIQGANSRTFTIRSIDVGYRLFVQVTASTPWGSSMAESNWTSVVASRPPSNTSSPIIEGEARLGAVLVATPGVWTGTAPISYSYQWQTCDLTETACVNMEGQTGQVMRVSSLDAELIRISVTATNVAGSASATSPSTDVIHPVTRPTRRCLVPRLRGRTLRAARAAIVRNRCRVGRVQHRFSTRIRAGRVVSQTPRAGVRLAAGTRIHLVVSKGKRR
jgi:PASTA domain